MSSLINFIKSLSTRIEKSTVEKDIALTLKEFDTGAIPSVRILAEQARVQKFKSKIFEQMEDELYHSIKFSRKGANCFFDLGDVLTTARANLVVVQAAVEEHLQKDTIRDGITARGAHMIRSVGFFSFISRFTLDLCDYLVNKETEELSGEDSSIPPARSKYISDNIEKYFRLLADYAVDTPTFKKLFENIPDIYVSDKNASAVSAMFRPQELDPFKNNIFLNNFRGNPIYHVRMMMVDWEARRYNAAKDKVQVLKLRLIHLKNLADRSPAPRVEIEIEGIQKRIDQYDRYLREVEDSVAD